MSPTASEQAIDRADYIVVGGHIYDGTGAAPVHHDIAIAADRIVAIGPNLRNTIQAGRTIDATGLAVAPGFIDVHTHSDLSILLNARAESSIHQGVTTEVMGNCGMSMAIVGEGDAFAHERRWIERGGLAVAWDGFVDFFDRISDQGSAINLCSLVGHGTIRKRVIGMANRPPDAAETLQMQRMVQDAMDAGVVGLSTGLEYLPGGYAQIDEICDLASVTCRAGGWYASHMRNEGDTLADSVEETLAVGRRTGVSLQISHHKAEGRRNWGKAKGTLAMMDDARRAGIDVLTDQYPYTAFMTGLSVIMLPDWANAGTPDEVVNRLGDATQRRRVSDEILLDPPEWDQIFVGVARVRREVQGFSLAELGKREAKLPVDAAIDLLIAERGMVSCAYFALSEDDVQQILRDPFTMIGSDGVTASPIGVLGQDRTHPRSYGTFPKVLSLYVRDKAIISLQEAIRRMTTLPAGRIGLIDRGHLKPGAIADIVVFDANAIEDKADFISPHRFPTGISHVFVNGRIALENGSQNDTLAGRVLRRGN